MNAPRQKRIFIQQQDHFYAPPVAARINTKQYSTAPVAILGPTRQASLRAYGREVSPIRTGVGNMLLILWALVIVLLMT